MGRLQKKKTTVQKARQKVKEQQSSLNNSSDDAVVKKSAKKNFTAVSKSAAAEKANQEPGLIEKCQTFLKEVNAELKKVVWPAKNQTIASTVVVIVLVIIVSSFLGLFDVGLKALIGWVLQ